MQIELLQSEINTVSQNAWPTLNISERAAVASQILRRRGDMNSQKFAFYIETGNPNFKDFVVLNDVH